MPGLIEEADKNNTVAMDLNEIYDEAVYAEVSQAIKYEERGATQGGTTEKNEIYKESQGEYGDFIINVDENYTENVDYNMGFKKQNVSQ